ncbi:class I SAM-dependent methyltransferase [Kribbella qitaiheensis]|uniref:class I SAM-dependent methyltransferase n=1 Tax=Kribbella qitaiheensis TaxID=1544730 RepID=UPI00361596B7
MSGWAAYDAKKRELVGGLSGTVLELGAGKGANFGMLGKGVDWIGLEPHAASRRTLESTAATWADKTGGSYRVLDTGAEQIPLPSASVDAVLSTVVLCSVDDLGGVLNEVRRVLRPAGRFVFFEHIGAARGSWVRRLQGLIRPITRTFDKGCDPTRQTGDAIQSAGFTTVTLDRYTLPGLVPIPYIAGTAHL